MKMNAGETAWRAYGPFKLCEELLFYNGKTGVQACKGIALIQVDSTTAPLKKMHLQLSTIQ